MHGARIPPWTLAALFLFACSTEEDGSGGDVGAPTQTNDPTQPPTSGTAATPPTSTTGGAGGTGTTDPVGTGDPTVGAPGQACAVTAERVRITDVDVGSTVLNDENEAALRPLAIAAIPSGGSRIAWMGDDGHVHVATLDANDALTGEALALPANDFGDLYADDAGGVLLVGRDAQGDGAQHCGTLTNLCGNVSSLPAQAQCWDMYMVRFDGTTETWATSLTESSPTSPPYMSAPTDDGRVIYLWDPYAHHGRIASDGTSFAGYFGAAISVSETCVQPDTSQTTGVNIHQGDRMQVVGPGGELQAGMGSFGWGCSHSGYERILWDPAASRFVTVCKTDNQNRIALAPSYSTIAPVDLAASNLGDLALATGGGYWLAASDVEAAGAGNADVSLLRFSVAFGTGMFGGDTATLDATVPVAAQPGVNERAPHLAAFGTDGLLVAWETADGPDDLGRNDPTRQLFVQARSADTGDAIGDPFAVDVLGNRYQSFRAFPDGSVAFLAPGTTATSLRVLRVSPCPAEGTDATDPAAPIDPGVGSAYALVGYATLEGGTTGGSGDPDPITVHSGAELQAAIDAKVDGEPLTVLVEGHLTHSDWRIALHDVSDVSILGVGAGAELDGVGIDLTRASNVIIRNLTIHGVSAGEGDAIRLTDHSHHVWIDHNTLSSDLTSGKDFYDGLVDVGHGSDLVTVSWNLLRDHHKVSLVGHSDDNAAEDAGALRITYHHNHFRRVGSRLPSVRFGTVHVFSNLYDDVTTGDDRAGTAVSSRMGACVRVESNAFVNVLTAVMTDQSGTLGAVDLVGNDFASASVADMPDCTLAVPYAYEPVLDAPAEIEAALSGRVGAGVLSDAAAFETL